MATATTLARKKSLLFPIFGKTGAAFSGIFLSGEDGGGFGLNFLYFFALALA